MIYVIQAASGPVKIGHAKNVAKRFAALQNGNHDQLTLLWTFEHAAELEVEGELKLHYRNQRIRGEWYDPVILDDLQDTLEWCADHVTSRPARPRNPDEVGFRWSRQDLLDAGQRWKSRVGAPPRSADWTGIAGTEWPSYQTCIREFGSWSFFLALL